MLRLFVLALCLWVGSAAKATTLDARQYHLDLSGPEILSGHTWNGGGSLLDVNGVLVPLTYDHGKQHHLGELGTPSIFFDGDYEVFATPSGIGSNSVLQRVNFNDVHVPNDQLGDTLSLFLDGTWTCNGICQFTFTGPGYWDLPNLYMTRGTYTLTFLPLPSALPLFATALAGLGFWRSRARMI